MCVWVNYQGICILWIWTLLQKYFMNIKYIYFIGQVVQTLCCRQINRTAKTFLSLFCVDNVTTYCGNFEGNFCELLVCELKVYFNFMVTTLPNFFCYIVSLPNISLSICMRNVWPLFFILRAGLLSNRRLRLAVKQHTCKQFVYLFSYPPLPSPSADTAGSGVLPRL